MALVILLGTAMFYLYEPGIRLGSFTLMIKLVFAMAIIGLGILYFLIRPELEGLGKVLADSLVLALPYLVTVFFSMILWMLNNCFLSDITRGISEPLYQLMGIVAAAAYMVMFREKGIYVQFASMALANILVIFQRYIRVYGVSSFVKDFFGRCLPSVARPEIWWRLRYMT